MESRRQAALTIRAEGDASVSKNNYQRLPPQFRESRFRKLPCSFLGRTSFMFNARSSRVPLRRDGLVPVFCAGHLHFAP